MASIKTLALAFGLSAAALGVGGRIVYDNVYSYSRGDRTGEIFKFSEKGTLCKTWEGQMVMNGYGHVDGQGTTGNFEFTVMDKTLIPKIEQAMRTHENVDLTYREVKWKASCLQDSYYVVTDIQKVDGQGNTTPFMVTLPQRSPKR
jgi:hypothetical protein